MNCCCSYLPNLMEICKRIFEVIAKKLWLAFFLDKMYIANAISWALHIPGHCLTTRSHGPVSQYPVISRTHSRLNEYPERQHGYRTSAGDNCSIETPQKLKVNGQLTTYVCFHVIRRQLTCLTSSALSEQYDTLTIDRQHTSNSHRVHHVRLQPSQSRNNNK